MVQHAVYNRIGDKRIVGCQNIFIVIPAHWNVTSIISRVRICEQVCVDSLNGIKNFIGSEKKIRVGVSVLVFDKGKLIRLSHFFDEWVIIE